MNITKSFLVVLLCFFGFTTTAQKSKINILNSQKISDTQGGFSGTLDNGDYFGVAICSIGDLDSNGANEIVVGAHLDDDGGTDRGAIWVLFMNTDGTVKDEKKISDTQGNFNGGLDNADNFGVDVYPYRRLGWRWYF